METLRVAPEQRRADLRLVDPRTLGVLVGLVVFSAAFVMLDQAYVRWVGGRFPPVGTSTTLATLYGVVSRLHVIVPLTALALWRPRSLGFRVGHVRRRWRLLVTLLVVNCGIVGGYLLLSGSATPYSGNEWLMTEVLVVPLVEETMWRGAVFAALLSVLRRIRGEGRATTYAVWLSGLAFGLLHGANGLVGVPWAFVAVQVLNAAVWGVVYGYARALTGSVYPPIALHSAMNLVVVLL
jgi:membrane protease YdiL (CAAX protease family)